MPGGIIPGKGKPGMPKGKRGNPGGTPGPGCMPVKGGGPIGIPNIPGGCPVALAAFKAAAASSSEK